MNINIVDMFDHVVEKLSAAGKWFACIALIVVAIGVTVNAFSRFFLKQPLMFVDEYAQYLLVAIFYFGVGYTLRAGKHVSVRMLVDRLGSAVRAWVHFVVSFASMGVIGMLAWYGWLSFLSTYRSGMVSLTPLETPLAVPFLFMSLGMFVFFLEALAIVLKAFAILLSGNYALMDEQASELGVMD